MEVGSALALAVTRSRAFLVLLAKYRSGMAPHGFVRRTVLAAVAAMTLVMAAQQQERFIQAMEILDVIQMIASRSSITPVLNLMSAAQK